MYKDFGHFHFQFEVDFTFNDIKVKEYLKYEVFEVCNTCVIPQKVLSTFCPCSSS